MLYIVFAQHFIYLMLIDFIFIWADWNNEKLDKEINSQEKIIWALHICSKPLEKMPNEIKCPALKILFDTLKVERIFYDYIVIAIYNNMCIDVSFSTDVWNDWKSTSTKQFSHTFFIRLSFEFQVYSK